MQNRFSSMPSLKYLFTLKSDDDDGWNDQIRHPFATSLFQGQADRRGRRIANEMLIRTLH